MKKFLKVVGVLALLAALALGGLTVFIKAKFPPERIKALAAEQVKKALHRELKLGDVSVGLWRGLSLEKVALSENPGFAAGTFLSVERISVEPFLMPLLKGRVLIKRVSLEKPLVNMVRKADGTFNFSDLSSSAAPATPGADASPSIPLVINAVELRRGALSFDDEGAGVVAVVKDLSVTASAFSLTEPFGAALSCDLRVAQAEKPPLSAKLAFKGRLAPAGKSRVDVESLSLSADGLELDVKGSVADLAAEPNLDLSMAVKKLEARAFAAFGVPEAAKSVSLKGTISVKGILAALKLDGALDLAAMGMTPRVEFHAAVKDQRDVTLSPVRVTAGPAAVELKGSISDAPGAGKLDLTVKAAPFDLAPFAPLAPAAAEYKVSGKVGMDVTVTGTTGDPQVRGTVNLAGLGAEPMAGMALTGLTGKAAFTADTLDLPDLKGKLNGEALALKLKVKNFSRPEVTADGSLSALDLGKLQAAFSGPEQKTPAASPAPPPAGEPPLARAKGSFHIDRVTHPYYLGNDFTFAWDLTDAGPDLSRLNGTARISAAKGAIQNIPLIVKINGLLKRPGPAIGYSKLGGHMAITRGVLDTQDFAMDSADLDATVKGTTNLTSLLGDLRLVFKMPPGSGGDLGDAFTDTDGRPTVEGTIKGLITDPDSFSPDMRKAASMAVKNVIKKQAEKMLENLGGSDQEGQPKSAKEKALEQGLKAFDKFLKKKK